MARDYSKYSKDDLIAEIKELQKRKKYGLVWDEDQTKERFEADAESGFPVLVGVPDKEIKSDIEAPTNIMIEGDNYHALAVLNYTHKNKIDVIYIDPPYNNGEKSWKYNNSFVDENDVYYHSKWLSMMKKRLLLAKNLLKHDGVLICAIDKNEVKRLELLIEEIFSDHEQHTISIIHNPRGTIGKNFSYNHENAIFSFRKGQQVVGHREIREEDIDWRDFKDHGGESLRTDARNCFYPIIIRDNKVIGFGDVLPPEEHPQAQFIQQGTDIYIYPIDPKGIERKWRYARQSVDGVATLLRVKVIKKKGAISSINIEIGKDYGTIRTVWEGARYDAAEYGTKLVNTLINKKFPYPKSLWTVYDCLASILKQRKNSIVLDFFAGSGTTGHAVSLINKRYGDSCQFILCTNNEISYEEMQDFQKNNQIKNQEASNLATSKDRKWLDFLDRNGICTAICYPRLKSISIKHDSCSEITGLPINLRYYKTAFVPAASSDSNRIKLTRQATEMLCLRESTFEKVADKENFKIYKNNKYYTGIIWEESAIKAFKKAIEPIKEKIHVYVFSFGNDVYEEEFEDIKNQVSLKPIPEAILKIYHKIFEER